MKFSHFIFFLLPSFLQAQVGGISTFNFLNLSPSARSSGLGANIITIADDDLNNAASNPALLNVAMHGSIHFNTSFEPSNINYGSVQYGHTLNKYNINVHGLVQYVNYGSFLQTDDTGQELGNFTANENLILLGASYQYSTRLALGLNSKFVSSRLEQYNATAMAIDLGIHYQDTSKNLSLGFVVQNLGTQFSKYDSTKEPLPLNVQLGFSKRLKHLPLLFTIYAHDLQRWNLRYDDPNEDTAQLLFGETPQEESAFKIFTQNLFLHLAFNVELYLGKNDLIQMRLGYNHQNRAELSVKNAFALSGFSLGFGVKVKQFRLNFGKEFYHIAGSSNHIGISTQLSRFKK